MGSCYFIMIRVYGMIYVYVLFSLKHNTAQIQKDAFMIPQALAGERLLSRYRIVDIKTGGGFGTVYICWDEKLKRRVAIKSIPLTDEAGVPLSEAMPDALAEARTAGFLNHPGIVNMLDFEEDAYHAYLIMEHIDGCTLAELIQQAGIIPFDEAAHIITQLADALTFAHENGVLHLDIKPENILIDHQANVKLSDFGMANLASAAGYVGARGGTLGYMPPEQLSLQKVDRRSDVFAFACVCYEMLSADAPFKAANLDESKDLILRGARSLKDYDPEVSTQLELILERALSPIPDIRYENIQSFSQALLTQLKDPREGKLSLMDTLEELKNDTPVAPQLPLDIHKDSEPVWWERLHPCLSSIAGSAVDCILYTLLSYHACQSLQLLLNPTNPLFSSPELNISSLVLCALIALFACFIPQLAYMLSLILISLAWILSGGLYSISSLFVFALIGILSCWWIKKARLYPHYLRIIMLPCILGPTSLIAGLPYISAALSNSSSNMQKGLPAWCTFLRQRQNTVKQPLHTEKTSSICADSNPKIDSMVNCVCALIFALAYSFYSTSYTLLRFSGNFSQFFSLQATQQELAQNALGYLFSPTNWLLILIFCLNSQILSLLFQHGKKKERSYFIQLKEAVDQSIAQADCSIETHFSHYGRYQKAKKLHRVSIGILLFCTVVVNYLLLSLANLMNLGNYSLFSPFTSGFALFVSAIIYFCIYVSVKNPVCRSVEHT